MNKTTIVAFLLLTSNFLYANSITPEINNIESQWATIYYAKNDSEQKRKYPELLNKTKSLSTKHPEVVELIIWQAIIISTNAAYENPFAALESINNAKRLLELAIHRNPNALDGAAFVTLGTLYYMTPGWPISFGDQNKAEKLLKKALKINPHGIESNYFYADYLLSNNDINKAARFFKLALKAPNRPEQQYADNQLKKEALAALQNTRQRKLESGKNKFLSLFSSANTNQY